MLLGSARLGLTVLAVTGNASMSVAAELDEQYTVGFGDGRTITAADGSRSLLNFDLSAEGNVDAWTTSR